VNRIASALLAAVMMAAMRPAVSRPATSTPQVVSVTAFGARCAAVTTDGTLTTLSANAAAGTNTYDVASTHDIVVGGQVILGQPMTKNEDITYIQSIAGRTMTVRGNLDFSHNIGDQVFVSGGYVSGADDTAAIDSAMAQASKIATPAYPATLQFPAGNCAISSGIHFGASNVSVAGEGMYKTTLVAMPSFKFDLAQTTRSASSGQGTGMIDLNSIQAPRSGRAPNRPQDPLTHVTIRDIGFDPRAGFQTYPARTGQFTFMPVFENNRALQFVNFENINCNLGTTLAFGVDLTKYFACLEIKLAVDSKNFTHDITFENIRARNGIGNIQMSTAFGCWGAIAGDTAYNITLRNISDVDDLNNIDDDRVVLDVVPCTHSGIPDEIGTVSNILFDGQDVYVSPSTTFAAVNAFKINALMGQIVNRVVYENVRYRGSPNGRYIGNKWRGGGAVAAFVSSSANAEINNVVIRNIQSDYASVGVALGQQTQGTHEQNITVDGVTETNESGNACVEYISASPPTGSDNILIRNFNCAFSPEAVAHNPGRYGVLLEPSPLNSSSRGASGNLRIENGVVCNSTAPVFIPPTAHANYTNLTVQSVAWDTGRAVVPRTAALVAAGPQVTPLCPR